MVFYESRTTLRDKVYDGTIGALRRWEELVRYGNEAAASWELECCDQVQAMRWKRDLDSLIDETKVIVAEVEDWLRQYLENACDGDVNQLAYQELYLELDGEGVGKLLMESAEKTTQWQKKFSEATEGEWGKEYQNLADELSYRYNKRTDTPPRLIPTTRGEIFARLSVLPEEVGKLGGKEVPRPMLFDSDEEDFARGGGRAPTNQSTPMTHVGQRSAHVDFVKETMKGLGSKNHSRVNNASDTPHKGSEVESPGTPSVRPGANQNSTHQLGLNNNVVSGTQTSGPDNEASGTQTVRPEVELNGTSNAGPRDNTSGTQVMGPTVNTKSTHTSRLEVNFSGTQFSRPNDELDKHLKETREQPGTRLGPDSLREAFEHMSDTSLISPQRFDNKTNTLKGKGESSSSTQHMRLEETRFLNRPTVRTYGTLGRVHMPYEGMNHPRCDSERDQGYRAGRRQGEHGEDRGRSSVVRCNVNGITPVNHSTPISGSYHTVPSGSQNNRSVTTSNSGVQTRMEPVRRLPERTAVIDRGHDVGNIEDYVYQTSEDGFNRGQSSQRIQTGQFQPERNVSGQGIPIPNGMIPNQADANGQAVSVQDLLTMMCTVMQNQASAQTQNSLLEQVLRHQSVNGGVNNRRATPEELSRFLEPENTLRYLDGKSLPPGMARNREGLHLFERFNSAELREACARSARYQNKRSISDNEIRSFNGDPIDFRTFIVAFRDVILRDCDSDVMKLEFLKRKCTGSAKDFLEQYDSTEAGFERAILAMFEKYDRPDYVIRAIHNKFAELKPVKEDLTTLDTTMSTIRKLISELDRRGQACGVRLIDDILLKFPTSIQDEARRNIGDLEMSNVAPAALVEEINRISIRRLDHKLTREARYESAAAITNCPSCKARGEHRMIKCPTLKFNSYTVQLCWKEQRCLRCFESDHLSAFCPDGACSFCGDRHHDQLCEAVREAYMTPRRARTTSFDRSKSRDGSATDRNRYGTATADRQRYGTARDRSNTPYGTRNQGYTPYGSRDRSRTPYGGRGQSFERKTDGKPDYQYNRGDSTPRVSFRDTQKGDQTPKPTAKDLTFAPRGDRKEYRNMRTGRSTSVEKPRYEAKGSVLVGTSQEEEECGKYSSGETGNTSTTSQAGPENEKVLQERSAQEEAFEAFQQWWFRDRSGRH